jgi:XTP/dITP diphosphohydrolase
MTVVLLDGRWPELVPAAGLELLRHPVQVTDDVVEAVRAQCTVVDTAPVLVSSNPTHPEVIRRRGLGQPVLAGEPHGRRLLDAVDVMDRLRSVGGCPWDAEQTHDSLRRYLVEECYELLDALQSGVPADVIEELGDVLLQVLFHARIADDFDIDDVAAALVSKLVHRHPHVFGAGASVLDASAQQLRWEELKAVEKRRESAVDGVARAQPALALAAKLVARGERAGVPAELVPAALRGIDGDAEDALRRAALGFAADVRAAEGAARADGLDAAALTASQWRQHWPPSRVMYR